MAASQSRSRSGLAAMKRLTRDLRELQRDPLEGSALAPIDEENLFLLHGNIVIPEGPYEGLLVHFILKMRDTFPTSSPAGRVAVNFPFSDGDHGHIHGGAMCNDMLSDFESYFEAIDGGDRMAASGWSSGVTLSSLLLVLKHYLADLDLPSPPLQQRVDQVFRQVAGYSCPDCSHTTSSPFPALPVIKLGGNTEEENDSSKPLSEEEAKLKQASEEKKRIEDRARSLLVCSASKENFVDNPKSLVLGYPLEMKYDNRKRMWTTLIPEPTSYEQYIFQIQEKGIDKLDNFEGVSLRTPGGHPYTHWLPVYINEFHFSQNRQCIENTISVLSNGIQGTKENEFGSWMVIRVLPCLMNKMIVAMMDGNLHESENAIYAYCHLLRLFIRFLDDPHGKLREHLDAKIERFISSRSYRNKQQVPDLGEMMVSISLSDKYSFYDKSVQVPLMEEAFARKAFWVEKGVVQKKVRRDWFYSKSLNEHLALHFEHSLVANKLMVFNLMASNWFTCPGAKDRLDACFGIPPQNVVDGFQQVIKNIKQMDNYPSFLQATKFDNHIPSSQSLSTFIKKAEECAYEQGYLHNGLDLPFSWRGKSNRSNQQSSRNQQRSNQSQRSNQPRSQQRR